MFAESKIVWLLIYEEFEEGSWLKKYYQNFVVVGSLVVGRPRKHEVQ